MNLRKQKPALFSSYNVIEKKIDINSWWGGRAIKIQSGNEQIVVIGTFTPQTINKYTEIDLEGLNYNYITGEEKPEIVTVPAHSFVMLTSFKPE